LKASDGLIAFFQYQENSTIVQQAMIRLLKTMTNYDADRSMRLSKSEIDPFFRDHFPSHAAVYEQLIRELFPQVITTTRDGSHGLLAKNCLCTSNLPFDDAYPMYQLLIA
jgi:hypothetical protein